MPYIHSYICSTQNLWGNYVNLLLHIKEWGVERWAPAQHWTGNKHQPWMATKTWLVHREIHLTYWSQPSKFLLNCTTSHSHPPENSKWLTGLSKALPWFLPLKAFRHSWSLHCAMTTAYQPKRVVRAEEQENSFCTHLEKSSPASCPILSLKNKHLSSVYLLKTQ